jgi:hypothetical protein
MPGGHCETICRIRVGAAIILLVFEFVRVLVERVEVVLLATILCFRCDMWKEIEEETALVRVKLVIEGHPIRDMLMNIAMILDRRCISSIIQTRSMGSLSSKQ